MPKPKRIPDGSLRAVSRDIRTVLRWAVCLREMRSVKIAGAYYNLEKIPSCRIDLETEDGVCGIRAYSIGRCYQFAAELIRTRDINDMCEGDETIIEGRDF